MDNSKHRMSLQSHRAIVILVALTTASTGSCDVSTNKPKTADLSYKPYTNVDATLLDMANHHIKTLDITGSMLGEQQFCRLCDGVNFEIIADFKASMNRLSAPGAVHLFDKLLYKKKSEEENAEMLQHCLLSLDLGFNPLLLAGSSEVTSRRPATSAREQKKFHTALQTLISARESCPSELHFECTGIDASTCRAVAKGVISRYAKDETQKEATIETSGPAVDPISLHLANNPGIGDPGVVAIAAALRTILREHAGKTILNTLDLSKCNIGDAGAEALAMALDDEAGRLAVRHLILSQNKIGNRGLFALLRAFPPETIVLDGNDFVTDWGMNAVADLILSNKKKRSPRSLLKLSLRSCSIKASGVERIGKALQRFFNQAAAQSNVCLEIDLSGNPLGVLRGKAKGDSKYSASRLKSTVSATASAYMNQGMSILKKGFGSTIESDDEEEMKDDELSGDEGDDLDQDRCGLKALANAFMFEDGDDYFQSSFANCSVESSSLVLGLRRTFCDTAGAEALAALVVKAKSRFNLDIKLDLALNPVLDEELIDALCGDNDELLHDMSDRHLESMEILRQAKQRAALAAKATAARLGRQGDLEAEWGNVGDFADLDSDHSYVEEMYEHEIASSDSEYSQ